MVNDNLIIADDDYLNSCTGYYVAASIIEEYLIDYLNVIDEMVDNKILEGQAAANLKSFGEMARQMLQEQLTYIMANQKRQMSDYITAIDSADSYLY